MHAARIYIVSYIMWMMHSERSYCLREKFRLTHVANNKSLLVLHQTRVLHAELFVLIFLKVFKMDINPRLLKSSKQYLYISNV